MPKPRLPNGRISRVGIPVDVDLHHQLKVAAVGQRITLIELTERIIREHLGLCEMTQPKGDAETEPSR